MSKMEQKILDVCCGSRMFWFDKNNKNAIYMDNRELEDTLCDGRKLEVKPDIVGDFRNIPFKDNSFIDYILNVQIPIIKNKKDIILKEVKINDLKKYSQVFIKYFSQIFNKENKFIKVIIYPKIVNRFSIFELVICDKKPNIDIEIKENVDYNKEIMTKFSIQKYTDMFYQIKDVVNFEENSFYIIKTNEYKNWHPAMANIDLDTIIEELLSENGGDC